MTTVKLSHGAYEHVIEASGHTEPKVCHAVTALLESLAGYLENTECEHDVALEEGKARICFDECSEVYRFMEIALRQIEYSFPKDLKIICES